MQKTLLRKERIYGVGLIAIFFPLTWGITIGGYFSAVSTAIGNIPYLGWLLVLIWLFCFLLPLAGMVGVLNPTPQWPVKFEEYRVYDVQLTKRTFTRDSTWTEMHGGATFSFDNIPYAKLFMATNLGCSGLETIDELQANLKSKDSSTRQKAVSALTDRALAMDTDAVEPLIQCLKDESWEVRYNAASVMGQVKDPRAVEPLILCLKDESWKVRYAAAHGLGEIGDVRALEPLNEAKEDQSRHFRSEAGRALKKLEKNEKRNRSSGNHYSAC